VQSATPADTAANAASTLAEARPRMCVANAMAHQTCHSSSAPPRTSYAQAGFPRLNASISVRVRIDEAAIDSHSGRSGPARRATAHAEFPRAIDPAVMRRIADAAIASRSGWSANCRQAYAHAGFTIRYYWNYVSLGREAAAIASRNG